MSQTFDSCSRRKQTRKIRSSKHSLIVNRFKLITDIGMKGHALKDRISSDMVSAPSGLSMGADATYYNAIDDKGKKPQLL